MKGSYPLTAAVCNPGVAFSIYIPQEIILFLSGITLIFIIGYGVRCVRSGEYVGASGLLFISFGALSNSIDRIVYGCVIDYLHMIPYFPWFNIADVSILIGAILFVFRYREGLRE